MRTPLSLGFSSTRSCVTEVLSENLEIFGILHFIILEPMPYEEMSLTEIGSRTVAKMPVNSEMKKSFKQSFFQSWVLKQRANLHLHLNSFLWPWLVVYICFAAWGSYKGLTMAAEIKPATFLNQQVFFRRSFSPTYFFYFALSLLISHFLSQKIFLIRKR